MIKNGFSKLNELINESFKNRLGIIRAMIIVLGLFVISVVWPMGKFRTAFSSEGTWDGIRFIGPGTEDSIIRQEFSPNFEHLSALSVYIVNEPDSFDTMETVLRVYSMSGEVLGESRVNLETVQVPGFVNYGLDVDLTPGELYFYTIGGVDGEVFVALCTEEQGNAEAGAFFYNGMHSGGTNVVARFDYIRPWGLKRIVIVDILIALITFVLYVAAGLFFKNRKSETVKRIEKTFAKVISALLALAAIAISIVIVALEPFEHNAMENAVLALSVLGAAAFLICMILTAPSMTEAVSSDENIKKFGRIISAAFLATAVIMCCLYQNSGSDYEHGLWMNRMLVFFGLFLYSLGTSRQIFNIPALLWSVASVFIGRYHISTHSDHIEHINTAITEAWLYWALGLIAIGLVYRVIDKDYKRLKRINPIIAGPVLAFWIICCFFANGRVWPLQLLLIFTVAFLFIYTQEDTEHMLETFCNAELLAFFGCLLFNVYRRPYQYYMMNRYGGVFITVTVTATYYLVAAAAALTKVLIAYRKNEFRGKLIAFSMLGAVTTYMFFTASRTGILALAAEVLFAFIAFLWQRKKGTVVGHPIKLIFASLATVIAAYIVFFGIARMLPAVIRNPFYYNYESYAAFIHKDTPLEGGDRRGENYITFKRSIETLAGRMIEGDKDACITLFSVMKVKAAESTSIENYSNGRLDIFRTYIRNLNMTGHDAMGCEDDNGNVIIHAHNAFIQVGYDFGIIVGALFILLCIFVFFTGVVKTSLYGKIKPYMVMLPILTVGFITAGMVEWIYHPMNPLGFSFILSLVLLSEKDILENV